MTPDVRRIRTTRGFVEAAVVGDGTRRAVLLVHGMPGSWRQAMPLAEDLADVATVVLPSRPGYGTTPISSGRRPEEQAALYAALLDTLGIGEASIVGISGGGPSAVAFANDFASRTRSLTLLCALVPHLMPVPLAMKVAAALPPLATAASVMSRRRDRALLADPVAVARKLETEMTPAEREQADRDPRVAADLEAFLWSHALAPPGLTGLRNDVRNIARAVRRGEPAPTRAITAPTLVAHGDRDPVVPFTHAAHHAEAIANARLETFTGAGHAFLLTFRPTSSALVRDHILGAER